MSAETSRAAFLSYASQDAEAARRICEALRAAGVEVWFDQNELRGGDQWDQKIRRQIRECALFLPVISANTNARLEGYFRREWKLAVERTHDMADEKAFLLPVVIDATTDAAASVPDKFRDVQWTRLRDGETPPAFCARVRELLGGLAVETVRPRPVERGAPPATEPKAEPKRRRVRLWLLVTALLVMTLSRVGSWFPRKPASEEPRAGAHAPVAENKPPAQTDAQKLIARIWEIYEKQQDGTGEEWALAEDLGAQAVKLEPTNVDAWAAYAQATWGNDFFNGSSVKHRDEAYRRALRATTLSPTSVEARFALANLQRQQAATAESAEKVLRQLVAEQPNDKRVLRVLAYSLRSRASRDGDSALYDEALLLLDRAAALPGGDPSALVGKGSLLALTLGRYSEGEAAYDGALKLRAGPNALAFKIILAFQLYGKLDEALALLKNAPGNFWLKEGKTALAAWLWLCKGDPKHALSVLGAVQSDYLEAGGALEFAGPRGVLTGSAQKMSGNLDAAQIEWRAALQVVEHRLTVTPNEPPLYFWKAWLFANLGQAADSRAALKIYEQYAGIKGPRINRGLSFEADLAQLYLLLGERAAVLDALDDREKFLRDRKLPEEAAILRNRLTYDPAWDALRGDKRFEALLGRLADIAASSR